MTNVVLADRLTAHRMAQEREKKLIPHAKLDKWPDLMKLGPHWANEVLVNTNIELLMGRELIDRTNRRAISISHLDEMDKQQPIFGIRSLGILIEPIGFEESHDLLYVIPGKFKLVENIVGPDSVGKPDEATRLPVKVSYDLYHIPTGDKRRLAGTSLISFLARGKDGNHGLWDVITDTPADRLLRVAFWPPE